MQCSYRVIIIAAMERSKMQGEEKSKLALDYRYGEMWCRKDY